MFGYVRPQKGELKVREFEQFASVYCGLCHTLKKRYGFFARFVLNYDFTFLLMLLTPPDAPTRTEYCRCPASFRRKRCCFSPGASETAADMSLILAYWKLRDTLRDDGFWKGLLLIRPALLFLRRKYKKAAALHKEFNQNVINRLEELTELEHTESPSLDGTADKFALILAGASARAANAELETVGAQMLYHIGRLVYILDAYDDFGEDAKRGRYNPLRARFTPPAGASLGAADTEALRQTLCHSADIAAADFALLRPNAFADILGNIVYLGLPAAIALVLDGKWNRKIPDEVRRNR
jgi:hypothetical protein